MRPLSVAVVLVLALVGCQDHVFENPYGEREIAVKDDLYAASAIGSDHLWAAGYMGAIYRTQDGGGSWERLRTGTEKSLYDISFADEQNGWAVGRRGFIINTKDGGETWTRQHAPRVPVRHIFSVHAVSAQIAWAVGDWGARYKTDDGGKTWQDLSLLVKETDPTFQYLSEDDLEAFRRGDKVYDDTYLNDVFFLNEMQGWIAAEYGILYYTEDGGESWHRSTIVGKDKFDPVQFTHATSEVSRDQWKQLFVAGERLGEKQHLRVRIEGFLTASELRANDGTTRLADDRAEAVRDFLEGEGVSQDRIRILNATPFDEESVDMAAFTRSKIRAYGHAIIRVIQTPFLFDIKFSDPMSGLIAGLGGVILQSGDGGRTWEYRESGSRQALFSIAAGGQAMFAVGERGLHRQSTDSGLTWSRGAQNFQEDFEIFGFMRDIVFGNPQTGWVVGNNGTILKSTDGGLSWASIDVKKQPGEVENDVASGE